MTEQIDDINRHCLMNGIPLCKHNTLVLPPLQRENETLVLTPILCEDDTLVLPPLPSEDDTNSPPSSLAQRWHISSPSSPVLSGKTATSHTCSCHFWLLVAEQVMLVHTAREVETMKETCRNTQQMQLVVTQRFVPLTCHPCPSQSLMPGCL